MRMNAAADRVGECRCLFKPQTSREAQACISDSGLRSEQSTKPASCESYRTISDGSEPASSLFHKEYCFHREYCRWADVFP